MARLRKPAAAENPTPFPVLPLPASTASSTPTSSKPATPRTLRRIRRSPSKLSTVTPSETLCTPRRGLRSSKAKDISYFEESDSSLSDNENPSASFLVPKVKPIPVRHTTPRRRKVLGEVEGNGRRLGLETESDEDVQTRGAKRKNPLMGRQPALGWLHSRNLARSMVKKELAREIAMEEASMLEEVDDDAPVVVTDLAPPNRGSTPCASKTREQKRTPEIQEVQEWDNRFSKSPAYESAERLHPEHEVIEHDTAMEHDPENTLQPEDSNHDTDSAAPTNSEKQEHTVEDEEDEDPVVSTRFNRNRHAPTRARNQLSDSEEDEDPVVNPRFNRVRQTPARRRKQLSDSEEDSEYEAEEIFHSADDDEEEEIVRVESRQQSLSSRSPERARVNALTEQAERDEDELPDLRPARPAHRKGRSTVSKWAQDVIDLTGSPEPPSSFLLSAKRLVPSATSSRSMGSDSSDDGAILSRSPTYSRQRSPRKTPPLAPVSPSKLVSPSKKKNRIPQAPDLRPSLDAFWCPQVVNTWNEIHSPAKPLLSPRKEKLLRQLNNEDSSSDSDASFMLGPSSPTKKKAVDGTTLKSPSKKGTSSPTTAEIRARRKAFASQKHELARFFLSELDTTITGGRIGTLSAPTGGIQLIWSKTLKTTAGRANWRREKLRLRTGPAPTDIRVEFRHNCSIELAEKVIDDEERLINVLAHEYCHLATFMISEVRDQPHGKEFKAWAAQVSKAFAHRGVEVTTKHSYQIEYKYVWACRVCGYEFKRHSKSVDPGRHTCGRCKGPLMQVKPVPRGGKGAAGGGKGAGNGAEGKSEYQVFVKNHYGRVKRRLEEEGKETKLGNVMAAVAEEYRKCKEEKMARAASPGSVDEQCEEEVEKGVVQVEELLEGLNIQDEDV